MGKYITTSINDFICENNNNNKLVVYHSSNVKFKKFDLSKITNFGGDLYGKGLYFTDNIKYAKQFGKLLYKCEIKLNNPLDLTKKTAKQQLLNLVKYVDTTDENIETITGLINYGSYVTAFRDIRKYITFDELRELYDGVIGEADCDGYGKEYIVYNPKNIKIIDIT